MPAAVLANGIIANIMSITDTDSSSVIELDTATLIDNAYYRNIDLSFNSACSNQLILDTSTTIGAETLTTANLATTSNLPVFVTYTHQNNGYGECTVDGVALISKALLAL